MCTADAVKVYVVIYVGIAIGIADAPDATWWSSQGMGGGDMSDLVYLPLLQK